MPSMFRQYWNLQDPQMPQRQQGQWSGNSWAPGPKGIGGALGAMMGQPGNTDDDLDAVRNYKAPPMPSQENFPQRLPLPVRPQQTLMDILPQLLAGAGDVVNAGAGRGSNFLNQAMGLQGHLRDQSFQDALQARQDEMAYNEAGYNDAWKRYGAEHQDLQHTMDRRLKLAEMQMMGDAMGLQRKKQEDELAARRAVFGEKLDLESKALATPEERDAYKGKNLMETQGDPEMMRMLDQKTLQGLMRKQKPGAAQSWFEKFFRNTGTYPFPEAAPSQATPGVWGGGVYNPWLGGYNR